MTPRQAGFAADPTLEDGLAPAGIAGLDEILCGGFPRNRLYLIQGGPGSGKTTLALQFLIEGVSRGETGVYVTLSETKAELTHVAASHGWSLDALTVYELAAPARTLRPDTQYTLFHPSEVELGEVTHLVLDLVERVQPARVVFDSLAELRLLARDSLRFRRQILALKQFFLGRQSTVLLVDDEHVAEHGTRVDTLVNGVVALEQLAPVYGAERRRLRIQKLRGVRYRGGHHDFAIRTGGIEVFPRVVAADTREAFVPAPLPSGVAGLDALLGGGIDRGTTTLVLGPAGTGKSSLAAQYAAAAVERGERAAVYVFDETLATYLHRSAGLGMDLAPAVAAGRLLLRQVDPAELSPGEFAHRVRTAVVAEGARVVVLDSLNGYLNAMPEERFLSVQLHELTAFLNQRGVATILVCAQHGLLRPQLDGAIDVSDLADTVVLMRYFETAGQVRQALSVVKRRTGRHERTVHELTLGRDGLTVGEPLRGFDAILTGTPRLVRDHGSPAPPAR